MQFSIIIVQCNIIYTYKNNIILIIKIYKSQKLFCIYKNDLIYFFILYLKVYLIHILYCNIVAT